MQSVTPVTEQQTSRRTVVRGAVLAAWAVPAVSIVSAAPAFATSTVTLPNLRGLSETSGGVAGLNRTLRVSIPLTYSASTAFPMGSTVSVTVTDPSSVLEGAPTVGTVPAGWRASAAVNSPAGSRAWRFTFTTTSASPTVPLVVTLAKYALSAFRTGNPTVTLTVSPVGRSATTHLLTWA